MQGTVQVPDQRSTSLQVRQLWERDGAKGFASEFAWMAVWPHVANDTERAADRLAVLVVPWERPMHDDLRRTSNELAPDQGPRPPRG